MFVDFLMRYFSQFISNNTITSTLAYITVIFIIFVIAIIIDFIIKRILLSTIFRIVEKTKNKWDDIIFNKKVFIKLSHIAPGVIFYLISPYMGSLSFIIERLSLVYITIMAILAINAFLNALVDIFKTFDMYKKVPLKGYVQIVQIFVFIVGGIIAIGLLINKSPWKLISGIGAMTAVLMLIFKDTILGFVASVQLSANDMLHIGDWIEMQKHGADGNVIDITVSTVKVRNWDNTITTIPTYSMISDSFKNWRGMQESGVRRVKRSIYINANSIKICNESLVKRFENMYLIKDYIKRKKKDIEEYNKKHAFDDTEPVNGRKLTNIGTFRAYLYAYLRQHPHIDKSRTILVRQLKPTEHGVPIEIYAFIDTTVWVDYEDIQSDIFDHIFASLPRFDLKVFQYPTDINIKGSI